MRKRYQKGSVTPSPCGRYWLGKFRDANGKGRTKSLGKRQGATKVTKSRAWEQLAEILKPINAAVGTVSADCTVKEFIEDVYLPFYRRKWRPLTAESRTDSVNRHIVGDSGIGRYLRSSEMRCKCGSIASSRRRMAPSGWRLQQWTTSVGT